MGDSDPMMLETIRQGVVDVEVVHNIRSMGHCRTAGGGAAAGKEEKEERRRGAA